MHYPGVSVLTRLSVSLCVSGVFLGQMPKVDIIEAYVVRRDFGCISEPRAPLPSGKAAPIYSPAHPPTVPPTRPQSRPEASELNGFAG